MIEEAVLIHGWDPNIYNSNVENEPNEGIAWAHRAELIQLLSENYHINYFNLPGFCGVQEPKDLFYDVENFTNEFALWMNQQSLRPDLIIGYSFGGAIALDYKTRFDAQTPTVLISPAIARQESEASFAAHKASKIIPTFLLDDLKHIYQYIFSRYYREGTPFLRKSYDKIVRRDLSEKLLDIDPGGLLLIYGDSDEATPFNLVAETLQRSELTYLLIEGGKHNIGQTHPREIMEAINSFLHKNCAIHK